MSCLKDARFQCLHAFVCRERNAMHGGDDDFFFHVLGIILEEIIVVFWPSCHIVLPLFKHNDVWVFLN